MNWNACPDLAVDRKHIGQAGAYSWGRHTVVPMTETADICFNLDRFNYTAVVPDVVTRVGVAAAAVVNFPFTRVP